MAILASGTSSLKRSNTFSMVSTSLCKKYTWPPRLSSRTMASRTVASENGFTKVFTAKRRLGAVVINEKSRKPSKAMDSVRGIGVAVMVSTSTLARKRLSCSFWRTPKRCSSSMMTKPKFLNSISGCTNLCVPITMSTVPSCKPAIAALVSLLELKRDNCATLIGKSAKRSAKFCACCSTNKVVGANTATCLPPITATNAARSATSVLPKPTSPQINLSIGLPASKSLMVATMALAWSSVSS